MFRMNVCFALPQGQHIQIRNRQKPVPAEWGMENTDSIQCWKIYLNLYVYKKTPFNRPTFKEQ